MTKRRRFLEFLHKSESFTFFSYGDLDRFDRFFPRRFPQFRFDPRLHSSLLLPSLVSAPSSSPQHFFFFCRCCSIFWFRFGSILFVFFWFFIIRFSPYLSTGIFMLLLRRKICIYYQDRKRFKESRFFAIWAAHSFISHLILVILYFYNDSTLISHYAFLHRNRIVLQVFLCYYYAERFVSIFKTENDSKSHISLQFDSCTFLYLSFHSYYTIFL